LQDAANERGTIVDGHEGAHVGDDGTGGDAAGAGATLAELSEKLARLRQHLEHLASDLNGPSSGADGRLRCHECGRVGSKSDAGWTLRLCADDELHHFCPEHP
jgi:hypothetical protein